MPKTIRTSQGKICLEQRLTGVTRRQVRRRSLEATGVNVTFAGVGVDPVFVGEPKLFAPPPPQEIQPTHLGGNSPSIYGLFSSSAASVVPAADPTATVPRSDPAATLDAEADAFVRFNLTVDGLPLNTSGTLETRVSVASTGRYYYEIVWYELELTVPTFYSGAEYVTIREGELLGLDYDEIQENLDELVSGSAVFFPCTNFLIGPFCEEREISA